MNEVKLIEPISKRATDRLGDKVVQVVVTSTLSQPTQLGSILMQRPILIDCKTPNYLGWMDLEKDVRYLEYDPELMPVKTIDDLLEEHAAVFVRMAERDMRG